MDEPEVFYLVCGPALTLNPRIIISSVVANHLVRLAG